jgi:hypothetical protein
MTAAGQHDRLAKLWNEFGEVRYQLVHAGKGYDEVTLARYI